MIRSAELKDAPALAKLTQQLGYEVNIRTTEARLSRILAFDFHKVFVYEDDTVTGWAHVYGKALIELDYAEIGGIVVDQNIRRSGVGLKLMKACENWAKENGYEEIRLRSGEKRKQAHQFYLSLGYEHIDEQKVFKRTLDEGTDI